MQYRVPELGVCHCFCAMWGKKVIHGRNLWTGIRPMLDNEEGVRWLLTHPRSTDYVLIGVKLPPQDDTIIYFFTRNT